MERPGHRPGRSPALRRVSHTVRSVVTIYVDGSAVLWSDEAASLQHLADAGYRVILVAPIEHSANAAAGPWRERIDTIPEDAGTSWFVTADPAACGDRRAGIRTILVGPNVDRRPPTRCDETARDLRAAVLDILALDAMA
jgi:hypothetical protein